MNPYFDHVMIRVLALLLPFLAAHKYKHFAWVLAIEMAVSACYLQITWVFLIYDAIYYDILLLYHSLAFFFLLQYRSAPKLKPTKSRIDRYYVAGGLLLLANAVYYASIVGEHLAGQIWHTSSSVMLDAHNRIMIILQMFQFLLLISVIDFDRIFNFMQKSFLDSPFVPGWSRRDRLVNDTIVEKSKRARRQSIW